VATSLLAFLLLACIPQLFLLPKRAGLSAKELEVWRYSAANESIPGIRFGDTPFPFDPEKTAICQTRSGLSAFFFLAAALWIWPASSNSSSSSSSSNPFTRRTPEALICVVSLLYLALGNVSFHLFCAHLGHFLDASGMIVIIDVLAAHSLSKMMHSNKGYLCSNRNAFFCCYLLLLVLSFTLYFAFSALIPIIIVSLIFVAIEICLSIIVHKRVGIYHHLGVSTFIFSIAVLQDPGHMKTPNATILRWLHAAWHGGTCCVVMFLFAQMRLDEVGEETATEGCEEEESEKLFGGDFDDDKEVDAAT
jgi:hypothetical protein